jgi:hypothetical protein
MTTGKQKHSPSHLKLTLVTLDKVLVQHPVTLHQGSSAHIQQDMGARHLLIKTKPNQDSFQVQHCNFSKVYLFLKNIFYKSKKGLGGEERLALFILPLDEFSWPNVGPIADLPFFSGKA